MDPRTSRAGLIAAAAALLLAAGPRPALGHEIPGRVAVLAFLKPEGNTLRVLVRAPLGAMRDINFPQRGPGYLDLAAADLLLLDAANLWIRGSLEIHENGRRLEDARIASVRVSLPSDRSFESYDRALALVTGPRLPAGTELVWQQGVIDVLLEYAIESDGSSFEIRPAFAHLGLQTTTLLRFLPQAGGERAYQFTGNPGLVRLDPRWHHAFFQFVRLGFLHILDGIDHLLFILCLVIPFRKLRPLVAIVTSFTVAHSITLIAATLGLAPAALWFAPLIETLIAISILYMAFENILGARVERRWALAFGFGLVHGFGFSLFLRDSLQFAGAHLPASLLAFNLGVELGQLLVVAVAVPVLVWLFRRVPERIGIILLSALVTHTAWHWMADRAATLRQYRFEWPALDTAFLAGAMRALLLLLIIAGFSWLMLRLVRRFAPPPPREEPAVGAGTP
jgi:hypothetical protein